MIITITIIQFYIYLRAELNNNNKEYESRLRFKQTTVRLSKPKLMACIPHVSGSNLGRDTDYSWFFLAPSGKLRGSKVVAVFN
jgi:hypothetical protein